MLLVPQPLFGFAQLDAELRQIATADVLEFHPLEVVPDPLIRVQLRCIAGLAFQMDVLGSTDGQKVLDDLTAMDGRTIPDGQQLARDMTQEMLEKADNTITPESLRLHLHVV